jgi:hypothetical protein
MGALVIRLEDWPSRLHAAVEAARSTPFAWGSHDCILFAADCVAAMTGDDLAASFRGRYATREEAYAVLAKIGGGLEYAITQALGKPAANNWRMAQRGDVVVVDAPTGTAAGIVVGSRVAVPDMQGLAFLPLSAARCYWRI